MTSGTYHDLFDRAFALRSTDVDASVRLFREAFAASEHGNIDALIHAALALRDAGRIDDAREVLIAAQREPVESRHKVYFEHALLEHISGQSDRAVSLLRMVPAYLWDDNYRIVEIAALLASGYRSEAIDKVEALNRGAISYANSFFADLLGGVIHALGNDISARPDDALAEGLFDNALIAAAEREATLKTLAQRMDIQVSVSTSMESAVPRSRSAHSCNVWILGYRIVFERHGREDLRSVALDYVRWLAGQRQRVHPSALKNLIKSSALFEESYPTLIGDLMVPDLDNQPSEEQIVAAELSMRAGRRDVLAPGVGAQARTYVSQFAAAIKALPLSRSRGPASIPTAEAKVLVMLFGQCRDPELLVPRLVKEIVDIGFAHVDFAVSTWSEVGHHLPPHRTWLRRQIDSDLAIVIEQKMNSLTHVNDVWSDTLPVADIYQAFPALRSMFEQKGSLGTIFLDLAFTHTLLLDEADFERRFARFAALQGPTAKEFLLRIRNTFKMWECIGAGVADTFTSPPKQTPDFLLLVRPDLVVRSPWKDHFPPSIATNTLYTDIDRDCLSVGMGGLGDRYVLLPYAARSVLQVPQNLISRPQDFYLDRHPELQRLAYHQLIESVLIQSGIPFDLTSLTLPYDIHRKIVTLNDYKHAAIGRAK